MSKKFESLGFFSSERIMLRKIISLHREVVQTQRELLDYQAGKIHMLQEQIEGYKK